MTVICILDTLHALHGNKASVILQRVMICQHLLKSHQKRSSVVERHCLSHAVQAGIYTVYIVLGLFRAVALEIATTFQNQIKISKLV